jgi:hypothetical protein
MKFNYDFLNIFICLLSSIISESPLINTILESASLIGLLLYSIWSRLRLSLKALVV